MSDCPTKQLDALIDQEVDLELHAEVLKHLDACEPCQARLHQAAASDHDWSIVSEALSDGDHSLSGTDLTAHTVQPAKGTYDPRAILQLLAPTDNPQSAGRIGNFEIVGIIGSGGMGVVLKAREPALDRFVAIKVLAPHLASSKSARKRFAREARAAAAVIHENVIPIYQVAHWNDLPYLVMPYMPDPSLGQRLEEEGPLSLEAVLSIGSQIAKGLAAAHNQGLVHRDVKPANVLLSKGTERAIITDFGLARATDDASLTRAGVLTGTPHYMSPEQARGEQVDQKSDLFSLGSVLFAMLTGEPPVDRELGSETIERISKGDLRSIETVAEQVPDWLEKLVKWLHQPKPSKRPESSNQVAELLEQCIAHHRQPTKTPLPKELTTVESGHTGKWLLVAGAATTLLLLGLAAVWPEKGAESPEVNQASIAQQRKTDAATLDEPTMLPDLDWSSASQELDWLEQDVDALENALNDVEPGMDPASKPASNTNPTSAVNPK